MPIHLANLSRALCCSVAIFLVFNTAHSAPAQKPKDYEQYVISCVETLLEKGRDHYGPHHTPMFMSLLDVRSLDSPAHPKAFDVEVRTEGRPHRRAERGSNLWNDQILLRTMYLLSELKNDPRFAQAADDYIQAAYDLATSKDGLLIWGTHSHYDAFKDQPGGDRYSGGIKNGEPIHEILIRRCQWQRMYAVAPQAVKRHIDAIWKWHVVDKKTGLHNRHDDQQQGCDFAFSAGPIIFANACLFRLTGDEEYLNRAKTIAAWYWNARNRDTGLVADCPGLAGRRYDGDHCFTTITGPFASALLDAYTITGQREFQTMAVSYIKSYDRFGWNQASKNYWAMLELDGTPVPEGAKAEGYDAWIPSGYVNIWRVTGLSYEHALCAAQSSVLAYELSGDSTDSRDAKLLTIAKRWAHVIENAMPPKPSRRWGEELITQVPGAAETGGAYAEDYGRSISFFVNLYRVTGKEKYLALARKLANQAIDKLYVNDLFQGHPAVPYYDAFNGVGFLLFALLEINQPESNLGGAF